MTNKRVEVTLDSIDQTIAMLRRAGQRRAEGVVLWLGRRQQDCTKVIEVYEPEFFSEEDFFRIPEVGMRLLFAHLGERGLHVAAQVHSHPKEAFHSKADDLWAIVRHVGALSMVLPYFASNTTAHNFMFEAAVFQLSGDNCWVQVPEEVLGEVLEII